MSAAYLWIFLPAAAAGVTAVWGERFSWLKIAACGLTALLAYMAWVLPVNETVPFFGLRFQVLPEFIILGRRLLLDEPLLRIVAVLYAALFLWCTGALLARATRFFIPTGLAAGAFLTAAWSVEPWQFAGIFIMLAVVILLPVLTPPGEQPSSGVLRFIAFQTIGVPFFLLAGTLMEGIESIPAGLAATVRPSILLGFAFAFLLAVFPFHAWIPSLFERDDGYVTAFVLVLLPVSVGVIGLQVIDRYLWLRGSESFFTFVRTVGIMNVLMGGVWVMSQRNAGRIFAFCALVDTGTLLIAIGAGPDTVPALFFPLAAARCIVFFAFGAGLKLAAARRDGLGLENLRGLAQESPLTAAVLLIGPFSTAGLPLLVGFYPRLQVLVTLSGQAPSAAVVVLLGMAAAGAAGLRLLAVLVKPPESPAADAQPPVTEEAGLRIQPLTLLGFAAIFLVFAAGLLPGWTGQLAGSLQGAFVHLLR